MPTVAPELSRLFREHHPEWASVNPQWRDQDWRLRPAACVALQGKPVEPLGRTKSANERTIFDFFAENARTFYLRVAEWPNLNTRRILHRFFELGVLVKGIDGGLQLVGGIFLFSLSPATINGMLYFFVRGELREDPTDLFVNLLLHATRNIIQSKTLAGVFLLLHGGAKLLLVGGLANHKLWSYPAAIVVFAAFTVYQLYELVHQASLFMGTITIMDIIVVVLIAAEYRQVRMARRGSESTAR